MNFRIEGRKNALTEALVVGTVFGAATERTSQQEEPKKRKPRSQPPSSDYSGRQGHTFNKPERGWFPMRVRSNVSGLVSWLAQFPQFTKTGAWNSAEGSGRSGCIG